MTFHTASKLALGLLFCLTLRMTAQEPDDAAAEVRRLEEKWTEAYKRRDIDILSTLLTEDFVITVEDGATYSKAGYITHTADSTVEVEVAELRDLRIRVRNGGHIVVVTGEYHEKGRSKHKPYEYRDRLTDVWVKAGKSWQVLASQYSVPVK
jgi:ketosteroid isomerase-like protein